jgi:single-strand DNA-binding protein
MANYNRITLVGNVTRDPEVRQVGDAQLARFGLAVSRKTKQGEETTFFDIQAWRKLGEICAQYLHKGDSVLVSGRLNLRKYTNKDGIQATAVEVDADDMQMLGGAKRREQSGGDYGRPQGNGAKPPAHEEMFDDDSIPF